MTVKEVTSTSKIASMCLIDTKEELVSIINTKGIEYINIIDLRLAVNKLFDCKDITIKQKIKVIDNYIFIVSNLANVLNEDVEGMQEKLEELKKAHSSKVKKYYIYSISSDVIIISNDAPDIEDKDITIHFVTENKESAIKVLSDKMLSQKII